MHPVAIIVLIAVALIVVGIVVFLVLRLRSGKSLEFCPEEDHKGSDLVKAYHKKYGKKKKTSSCPFCKD
jgi:hypothetical protein